MTTRSHPMAARSATLRWILRILVAVTCLRVWTGPVDLLPKAIAQIPDSGRQRMHLVEEARETNRLLREALALLKSGSLQVRLEGTDKKAAGPRAARGR